MDAYRRTILHHFARHFKDMADRTKTIEEAVALAFDSERWGISIAPFQVREEIVAFLKSVASNPPKVILEIGTAKGGTLFLMARVASPEATIITVDLPGGPFGEGYPEWESDLFLSFAGPRQTINLVRGDSHSQETYAEVLRLLDGRGVDLLFIDGDHRYEGVRADFEMYSGLVSRGATVSFHDIVPGSPEVVGGVPEFWREVKDKHECEEIVHDWSQGGFGIGLMSR